MKKILTNRLISALLITIVALTSFSIKALAQCDSTRAIHISLSSPSPLLMSCGQNVTCSTIISGVTTGRTYTWSNGLSGANRNAISIDTPGTYSVTVTNNWGCSASVSTEVTYPSISNHVNFKLPSSPVCTGSASFINTSGYSNNWSSYWSFDSTGFYQALDSIYTYDFPATGNYTVTLYVDSSNCTFKATKNVTVTKTGIKGITISPTSYFDRRLCANESLKLATAPGYSQYKWSNGATDTFTVVTQAGDFTVTVTSQNGCTAAGQTSVFELDTPTITMIPAGPMTVCEGEADTIGIGSRFATWVKWFANDTLLYEGGQWDWFRITPLHNTIYKVIATDLGNGCHTTGSKSVTVLPAPPVPVISADVSMPKCRSKEVNLSANNSYNGYKWNTGQTASSIKVIQELGYTITCTGNNGCKAVSLPFQVDNLHITAPDICIVTVDSITGKNMIVWNKVANPAIRSYMVSRETGQLNIFEPVGEIPIDSFSVFIDQASNPAQKAERYYLSAIDTCGDTTQSYLLHRTIHLGINKGQNNNWNLTWNDYKGFSFPTYYIYRGNGSNSLQLIDSIASSSTSYTDINPPSGTLYYQVSVTNPSGCSPSRSINDYSRSVSNLAGTNTAGIDEVDGDFISVYPNPANNTLYIQAGERVDNIQVLDLAGNILPIRYKNGIVDIQSLPAGMYFIQVKGKAYTHTKRFIRQ